MARSERPYLAAVGQSQRHFPALKYLSDFAAQPTFRQPRLSILEFTAASVSEKSLGSISELSEYWEATGDSSVQSGICGRLYIVEDLSADYLDAIGSHFRIHPAFFLKYLYLPVFLKGQVSNTSNRLPLQPLFSMKEDQTGLSLRYYDLLIGKVAPALSNVTRKPAITKPLSDESSISSILRNISIYTAPASSEPWFGMDESMLAFPVMNPD
jgi:hypothetical protein